MREVGKAGPWLFDDSGPKLIVRMYANMRGHYQRCRSWSRKIGVFPALSLVFVYFLTDTWVRLLAAMQILP